MARLRSAHQSTGAVAGLCHGKVGKRLPQGPHKRRGGASARCRRQRSSGDARRRHRRSRLAPERGCLRQQTGVEMARLRSKRRGPGICPVSIVTGVEMARLRSKRRGPGICQAQGHRRMARLRSAHQSTGAVAGLCNAKSESDLSTAGVRGYSPTKKAGPAARGRPLNFAVTGGYYSSTIGLYLGTRAFMMLHAST